MSMTLSEPIQEALATQNGAPLELIDPRTEAAYVLIRQEVYEQLISSRYEDSHPTIEERRRHLEESGHRAGWDEPEMDVYDNYDENRKKMR